MLNIEVKNEVGSGGPGAIHPECIICSKVCC